MAAVLSLSCSSSLPSSQYYASNYACFLKFPKQIKFHHRKSPNFFYSYSDKQRQRCSSPIFNEIEPDPEEEEENIGVKAALSTLKFYKREISPLLPKSCRYVPSCSEYSMIAYKKYGVVKGSVLTAWRLCRCNPLGGSGFDPPRWFGEERVSKEDDL
ncbi:hypothetical protein RDABS01_017151 [Bienertia sinuspersici]